MKNWLLSVSQNTGSQYIVYMKRFQEFAQVSPDQLLVMAKQDRQSVHHKLKEFYEEMRSEGLSSKTRSVAYTAIMSFLSWNDLPLGRTPNPFKGKVQYEPYRMLEPHEVCLMIGAAWHTSDKALLSFLAQTGQSWSGLSSQIPSCET